MALSNPTSTTNYVQFMKLEASYGATNATPAGGDAIRTRTKTLMFKRVLERLDRDQDADRTMTVHTTQKGRESCTWEVEAALTPSGVTGTPTAPDMWDLFRAHAGTSDVGAGHSTCTAGSTTTVIEGDTGAVTALGAAVGDWIVATTTAGLEARVITAIATDQITVDRALSSAPANGSALYGTVTGRLSDTNTNSLVGWSYLDGDHFRQMAVGLLASDMEISIDLASGTPEAMVKFSGPGGLIIPHTATSIPTPTTAGQPLVPAAVYAWFGTTKHCPTSLSLKSNNGQELRNNEGCSMYPTGVKLTGNGGKRSITFDVEMLLTGSTIEGYYDNADALTAYDVIVQIGNEVGKSFAFRLVKFVPDTEPGEVEGEVSLALSGRAYGNGTAATELSFCFF